MQARSTITTTTTTTTSERAVVLFAAEENNASDPSPPVRLFDSTSVPMVQPPPTSGELVLVEQPQMTSVAISKSGNAPSATVLSTTMDLANIKAAMQKINKTPSKLKKILGKLIGKKRRNTLTPKDLKKLVKLCTKKVYKKVPTLELLNEVWNVAAAGGSELSESTLEKWLF